jgi:hypothetical protein
MGWRSKVRLIACRSMKYVPLMNKNRNKNTQSGRRTIIKDEIKVGEPADYLLPAAIFILSGIYFYLFGNHIFFYQENLSLFVFSREYLIQFASKPGGLLEYAGNFLSQGYFNNLYGTLVLSVVFTSIAIVFQKIGKHLHKDMENAHFLKNLPV